MSLGPVSLLTRVHTSSEPLPGLISTRVFAPKQRLPAAQPSFNVGMAEAGGPGVCKTVVGTGASFKLTGRDDETKGPFDTNGEGIP